MEPLKRKILYVKPKEKPSAIISFPSGVLVVPKSDEQTIRKLENHPANADLPGRLEQSKKITDWIATHPEFKWSAMCKKLGIDKGNFQRSIKGKVPNIKQEFIRKIEQFLKDYGYGS